MKRGTTPTITINIPYDAVDVAACWVTFTQGGTEVMTKTLESEGVTLTDGAITIELTQTETLAFEASGLQQVKMQVRIKTTDGKAVASDITTFLAERILKEGIIE